MANILHSLELVLPLFFIIFLGFVLKQKKYLPESFADDSSRLLFYIVLPLLFVENMWTADLSQPFPSSIAIVLTCGMTLVILIAWLVSKLLSLDAISTPSFISGSFRSNIVYVGFALLRRILPELPAETSIAYLIALVLLNVGLSVVYSGNTKGLRLSQKIGTILKGVVTNPLNIGLTIGFLLNKAGIPEPKVVSSTLSLLSAMASPLALLSIGVAINPKMQKRNISLALSASLIKLVVSPLIGLGLGILLKIPASSLVLVYMVFGTPTALNTFSLDRGMGGNSELVAAIILFTTTLSLISISAFVSVFIQLGYI
jgi:predicted permease